MNILIYLERQLMSLFKKSITVRISESDPVAACLAAKLVAGDNVSLDIENAGDLGDRIVISASKSQQRQFLSVNSDCIVPPNTYAVLVDASKNPVALTLPLVADYVGHLSIICQDASYGITLIPEGTNAIFDESNAVFHAKGDSLTLVGDRMRPPVAIVEDDSVQSQSLSGKVPPIGTDCGTWYIVGRYSAQWYA